MSGSTYTILRKHMPAALFPSFVVAVPAQNEAEHIAACLDAIADQKNRDGSSLRGAIGVVLLINNTTDATFEVASRHADLLGLSIRIYDVRMTKDASHAGGARRAAMNLAADWLNQSGGRNGVIFTTDADSIPAHDWVATARRALSHRIDGVAGTIDLHPQDEAALPAHVQARGRLEARYEALLTELFSLLDPRPHDPWPRHAAEAGANLAVTLRAYRAIGGLPDVACGEDRALVARLEHFGFKVRHDLAVRVSTSGRLTGRAAGGVADTIRLRCEQPEALCDDYLEPAWNAWFRGFWRGRLRRVFANEGAAPALRSFNGRANKQQMRSASFDAFWQAVEQNDPRLAHKLLRPDELPTEIAAAAVMVRRARQNVATTSRKSLDDSPAFVPAE